MNFRRRFDKATNRRTHGCDVIVTAMQAVRTLELETA